MSRACAIDSCSAPTCTAVRSSAARMQVSPVSCMVSGRSGYKTTTLLQCMALDMETARRATDEIPTLRREFLFVGISRRSLDLARENKNYCPCARTTAGAPIVTHPVNVTWATYGTLNSGCRGIDVMDELYIYLDDMDYGESIREFVVNTLVPLREGALKTVKIRCTSSSHDCVTVPYLPLISTAVCDVFTIPVDPKGRLPVWRGPDAAHVAELIYGDRVLPTQPPQDEENA